MNNKNLKILAIETSCDETAAAVIFAEGKKSQIYNLKNKEQHTKPVILSNIVSSQVNLHAKTGGVVPEVASRAHMEAMIPVIKEALLQSKSDLSEITHIAVTNGPGLIGSLLVGFNTAKSMAYSLDLPIIPINHIEGHIYSAVGGECQMSNVKCKKHRTRKYSDEANLANEANIDFPILALTVSGGHTSLTLMQDHGKYQTIGQTRDDAAGEAFDKVAKLLDLGYPGGPIVSKLADKFRNKISNFQFPISNQISKSKITKNKELISNKANLASQAIVLPRPMIKDKNFDFSFSGLKTAVLEMVKETESQNVIARKPFDRPTKQSTKKIVTAKDGCAMTDIRRLSNDQKAEICAAFEDAAVDVLTTKTIKAAKKYEPKGIILAGGVAANKRLREELAERLRKSNSKFLISNEISNDKNSNEASEADNLTKLMMPPAELCGDNATMIGLAAYYHIIRGDTRSWKDINLDSNFKL